MIILPCLLALSLQSPAFVDQLTAADAILRPIQDETRAEMLSADFAGSQQRFLQAVPEQDRTAAYYLIMGNMWFGMDPEFSYEMHAKAFAMAPEEHMVQREWALELHRSGEFAKALPIYDQFIHSDAHSGGQFAALQADCALALGLPEQAVTAWEGTHRLTDRATVAQPLGWIGGKIDPRRQRAQWIQEAKDGDFSSLEDLVLGDLIWGREGENYFVNYEYFEHDYRLAQKALGDKSERALDLGALADVLFIDWEQGFPKSPKSVPHQKLIKHAEERAWTGENARLPENARVTHVMLETLLRHAVDPSELLRLHGAELKRRALNDPSGPQALESLILLARSSQSPELGEIERMLPPAPLQQAQALVTEAGLQNRSPTPALMARIRARLRSDKVTPEQLDADFEALSKSLTGKH